MTVTDEIEGAVEEPKRVRVHPSFPGLVSAEGVVGDLQGAPVCGSLVHLAEDFPESAVVFPRFQAEGEDLAVTVKKGDAFGRQRRLYFLSFARRVGRTN